MRNNCESVQMSYSELKVVHFPERLASLAAGKRIAPAQVQLIISDLCNQDCVFCAYRMSGYSSNQLFRDAEGSNNPKRFIPTAKACEIIEDMASEGVLAAQFTGGGEPTVHPDHLSIFKYALEHDLKCALVTNGQLLRDGWRDILPWFAWLRVSLDAGTPESYASIRRAPKGAFRKALANVNNLVRCRDLNKTGCVIGTSFIVTKENWQEVYAAALLASEYGADNFRIAACFTPQLADYYFDFRAEALEQVAKTVELLPKGFVIDMFSKRLDDLDSGAPTYKSCGYQHFNVYIGGDLNVYRCCNTAYNEIGMVGSLRERRFKDWLRDPEVTGRYFGFDARVCEHCAFNRQNSVINFLTSDPPKHVEFV